MKSLKKMTHTIEVRYYKTNRKNKKLVYKTWRMFGEGNHDYKLTKETLIDYIKDFAHAEDNMGMRFYDIRLITQADYIQGAGSFYNVEKHEVYYKYGTTLECFIRALYNKFAIASGWDLNFTIEDILNDYHEKIMSI